MKIFHCADLHYCPKHLEYVDRAFTAAVDHAIKDRCDLAIIAGDSIDATMPVHEPAVSALVRQVVRLSQRMPVIVLQGTFSHDRPGALDVFRAIPGLIRVVDEPSRMKMYDAPMFPILLQGDDTDTSWPTISLCVLPSLNKADPDVMDLGPREWARMHLEEWGVKNRQDRTEGIPSILVTHGTVTGSLTESNYAMVSPDHEFDIDTLLSADCDAVMLGHIHKHQSWTDVTPSKTFCQIAYPGSIARLVYGQSDPAGYLIWDIEPGSATFQFHEAPSRHLMEVSFEGTPDMDDLRKIASEIGAEDHVRIRYSIDEEHVSAVDKEEIRGLFAEAGGVKIEASINPVQSVRSEGMGKAVTMHGRIGEWAKTIGDEAKTQDLCDRMQMLRAEDPADIVGRIITG